MSASVSNELGLSTDILDPLQPNALRSTLSAYPPGGFTGGVRYDAGKPPIHLIPAEAILALAEHYGKGAQKYEPRNWEKGMDWSRCYNSLMRHALAWNLGEDADKETDSHHMIAVAWNAIALYFYAVKSLGTDDRSKS